MEQANQPLNVGSMEGLGVMVERLERAEFEKALPDIGTYSLVPIMDSTARREDGLYQRVAVEAAWRGWKARGALQSKCRGVTRSGCSYLAACGSVCNKCGEVH